MRLRLLVVGTTVLAGTAPPLHPALGQGQTPDAVQRLTWLAGCWRGGGGATIVEEQWMQPRAGVMLGMSRTTRQDSVVEFEQLRIYTREGRAIYAASPSGQASAEFEARTTTDSAVTFENPAHDFPQRIIYRRRGTESLVARIEGTRGGRVKGVEFPYRRTSCP
jgi:hypothetical protein